MTVKELIENLSQLKEDLPITMNIDDHYVKDLNRVVECEDQIILD